MLCVHNAMGEGENGVKHPTRLEQMPKRTTINMTF